MSHLLLSENFPPKTGGSGRWFWELYRRLPRPDYVIAAGEHPHQSDFDEKHDLGRYRIPLTFKAWGVRSLKGLAGYRRALRALKPIIRTEPLDMIHCGRCLPEGLIGLALKWRYGLPYLCYVHGEDVTCAMESRELAFLVRRVLRNAELVIANSQNTRRVLLEKWALSPEHIHILHPGVDTNFFFPGERDPRIRQQLGWDNRNVVLTVGRLQSARVTTK